MSQDDPRPRSALVATLLVAALLGIATPARAIEVGGGVDFGGVLGPAQHFAVTPHLALSWSMSNGFLWGVHEMVAILPPVGGSGLGFYEQTAAVIGYTGETTNFSVGPSLSVLDMSTCGSAYCGRVLGVAPGAHAQANWAKE
jgi:hypothetical protein